MAAANLNHSKLSPTCVSRDCMKTPFRIVFAADISSKRKDSKEKTLYVLQSNKNVSEQPCSNEGTYHCQDQHDQRDKIKRRSYLLDILL